MRLWSLHPKYLDPAGLVALWREALLAQKVLRGGTSGYRNHPQLARFRETADAPGAIADYLRFILEESSRRGYSFDGSKIAGDAFTETIPVTDGQLRYELDHLKRKLRARNPRFYRDIRLLDMPEPHPLFAIVAGPAAAWERIM